MDAQGQPLILPAGTKVKLPYHINPETGSGYEIQVEADTPEPVFQEEVNRLFPKTLASLATQLLDKDPAAPMLSREDFMQVWNSAQAMDAGKTEKQNQIKGGPGFWKQGYDIIKEAIGSMAEGAGETAVAGAEVLGLDPNARSTAAVKLLNGIMTGTGRLIDSAAVVGALAWDKMAGDPYAVYSMGKNAQQSEYLRKTQGYGMMPGSSQEEIDAALKIGNIMDMTMLFPMVSALAKGMTKGGEVVAAQTMEELTKTMAERSMESLGRRAAGQVLENVGAITEKIGSVSAIGDSLTKGLLGKATTAGALAAAYVLPEEGLLGDVGTALGAYGTLRTMQTAGAGMKWAGKILGSEELASKITQQALRSAEVQGAERLAVKLVKNIPDPVVRMTRKVMDGAMIPAAIGATLSGAQEASDPFSTPLSIAQTTMQGGAAGAAAGGLVSGAIGIVPEFTGRAAEQSFVREIMTDLTTRPEQRSFVVGNQDIIIRDDIQNRLNVLNSDTMTTRQKASLFGILDSAEHAGVEVAFINDATPLPDALGGSGANMGKGVKFVNDGGKTTIFVNSDQINHTGAIHEVMHAYTSDQVATDFVRNLTKERGGEVGAFQELSNFAQRYYDTQVQTNPAAAEQIKASIDRMNDPQVPLQDRLAAATELAHEYIAEGMAQSLSDAKPESLQDFRGSAISLFADRAFRGALEKWNTATGMSSIGATHDPISGHFFKNGKIISSKALADLTKKVQTAINTRTEVPVSPEAAAQPFVERVPKDVPIVGETMQNGGRVVAVVPRATYEDTHPNGALTTEQEKAVYHKAIYNQVAQAMGATDANAVLIQQGVYPGNIQVGTPIIYADKLTPQHVSALFQAQTQHGAPLIAPENREAVARFAQALNDGHLVSVTHSVNVGKSTGKDRGYTARIDQIGLPMAFSMTSGKKGSGPKMEFFNLSLANDMINLNRTYSPMIDTALRELRINSLDDVIPYAKAYIDNLSLTDSVPSARALAAVAPEGASTKNLEFVRDMLHMSSAVEPRAKRGEVRINEPYMDPKRFRDVPNPELEAVTPQGQRFKTTLSRERRGIQSIRLDGISDVQLYQPNGQPVQVNVNKPQLINKIRAAFSPATSKREALPGGETVTDTITGERMFISPKGKVKLFGADGKLAGVFEDEEAAVLKSNQDKIKQSVRFSPKAADSAYLKAAQENNTQAAQRLVDEAAKAAGYTIGPVFHGTSKDFNIFKPNTAQGWGEGVYFASDKSVAQEFGGRVVSAFLKIDKPFTGFFSQADEARIPETKTYQNALKKYQKVSRFVDPETKELDWFELKQEDGEFANSLIRDLGYDGIISTDSANIQTGNEIVVFNPSQVKSAAPIVYDDQNQIIPPSRRFNVASADIRFSPSRTAAEKRATELAAEERKYGISSRTVPVSMILNEGEEISRAMNEIVRESTPTLVGKLGAPEDLEARITRSQAVLEQAAPKEALSKTVSKLARKRKEIQRRQAEIEAAVAKREAEGTIGPVPVGLRPLPEVRTVKALEDIRGGSPTKLQPELKITPDQLRQVFRNLDVEEFPTPQEAPPAVTDLISQKTTRSEITHRTVLGNIQSEAAKAARVGDMKIDQMLKAMSEKREAMFDAELARVRNKFDTMELQGKAEEARQAGIDSEIVRLRNEHFANVQQQIAQATEPAPLNSGTPEPPAQTLLPNMATAADDPRIPRDIVIQSSRGKFRIWSIGRQAVQAVTDTYQEALKKAQAIQLKRRRKQNAA
jgi:hypothetical protein